MSESSARPWVVMKFGGTSVSSPERWQTIVQQAERARNGRCKVLVVVSALSGVTNLLTAIADSLDAPARKQLLKEIETRHLQLLAGLNVQANDLFNQHWQSLQSLAETIKYPANAQDRASLLAHGELLSSSVGVLAFRSQGRDIC
ncbi:MAG TPA: bifunctional aspartate kinase/diaminopimelate decarboxylase, partial [Xanthomonadales bacterium]|nr:bifunctional aspartate kinase/diaminopimelate decarboxylase [Xanthomonadales bacterium]